MMEGTKILAILDFLSDRAKEFVQVSDDVLAGERALQARDGAGPTEWQVCSIVSAFINYVGESERCRYGHFVSDLEKKNSEHKQQDAINTLNRMKMFWEHDDTGDLSVEDIDARKAHIDKFLTNDAEIKEHLQKRPDLYEENVPQDKHREWSIKLRLLGEKEAMLLRNWNKLVANQSQTSQIASLPETHQQ